MKLILRYSEVLNASYELGDFNLMMVFQVNCPGCFMYGFPLMHYIQKQFCGKMSVMAMSTAFEDFELNTPENTKMLISEGEFVGETLKAHQRTPLTWQKPDFPILIDQQVSREVLTDPLFIDSIIQSREEWIDLPDDTKAELVTSITNYFGQLSECGYTFAANMMRGTPTFILFNASMNVLLHWFGHYDVQHIEEKLRTFIN